MTSHSFISIIHIGKFCFTTILFEENGELSSSAPLPVGAKGCFDHDAVDTARQAMTNALFPLYEEIMRLSPQQPTYNTITNGSSSEVKRFCEGLMKLVQSRHSYWIFC